MQTDLSKQDLLARFYLIQAIRDFFNSKGFLDVMTPVAVENPGMEVHIKPFKVENSKLYLHTSPEFAMKELLSKGLEKIFTINYCFRDEPVSPIHRPQFLMLEWYRAHEKYEAIMNDCVELFSYCFKSLQEKNIEINLDFKNFQPVKKTVAEIFQEILNIEILDYLEKNKLRELIHNNFKDVPLPSEDLEWEDYYFLLFLNKVEPGFKKYPFLILHEFPYQLAALSKLKKEDTRVCERFEIYSYGTEIANCFHELTDLNEQKKRFKEQSKQKEKLYNYKLPIPTNFYKSLERGLPNSSGIALGIERMLGVLTKTEKIFD